MQMYRNEHVSYDKQPNALVDTVNGNAYPCIMHSLSQSRMYSPYTSVEQWVFARKSTQWKRYLAALFQRLYMSK